MRPVTLRHPDHMASGKDTTPSFLEQRYSPTAVGWLTGKRHSRLTTQQPLGLKKLNSMIRVRERTIPTERPPLVGEVIANFCG
jgi:hypothetical protein